MKSTLDWLVLCNTTMKDELSTKMNLFSYNYLYNNAQKQPPEVFFKNKKPSFKL